MHTPQYSTFRRGRRYLARVHAQFATLTLAAILASLTGRAATDVPLCLTFLPEVDGVSALLLNDSHASRMYCDSESDVIVASSGGLGYATYDRNGPRRVRVALKNAAIVQTFDPILANSLPSEDVEFRFHFLTHNNPDGTLSDGAGGCLPYVTELLDMPAGGEYVVTAKIDFSGSSGTYHLRPGQPICGFPASASNRSDCPLRLIAGYDYNGDSTITDDEADLDGNGSVDIWTIEPLRPEAHTLVLKVNKKQQLTAVATIEMPFRMVFTRQQLSAFLPSP